MRTYGSWVKFVGLSSLIVVALVMIAPSIAAQFGDLLIRRLTLDEDGALGGGDEITIQAGILTPEGNVVGSPGDIYIEHDGTAGNVFHFKDGGTGDDNSGWLQLPSPLPAALVVDTLTLDIANGDTRFRRVAQGRFLFEDLTSGENYEIRLDEACGTNCTEMGPLSGQEVRMTSVATYTHRFLGQDAPAEVTIGRDDTAILTGEVFGDLRYMAPDEATGGDSILPGAVIRGIARGTFDATNNPTDIQICTSESEDCSLGTWDWTFEQDGDFGLGGQEEPRERFDLIGNALIGNAAEGGVAAIGHYSTETTVTLSGATTDTTFTIPIPSGAVPQACSFNVNIGVTDDAGDDTWSAAFVTGSTTTLATDEAAAINTKVDTLIVDEVTTAATEVQFSPNGGNFTAGEIQVVCYYRALTSLADV